MILLYMLNEYLRLFDLLKEINILKYSTIFLLGKQIFSSWQRLICEVGRTTVINTTVINNRNECEIYQPGVSGVDAVVRK